MTYSHRIFLYAPLGIFLVLCIAVGASWWSKASALSERLAALNGHAAMPDVTVSFATKKISGFPFNLDTEFSDFAVTVATPDGPIAWKSEKFAMHALTYGRDETIFEAAGRQQLIWSGHRLDFATSALHASAIVRNGSLDRFDLDVVGFGSKAFTAQRLQFDARRSGDDTIEALTRANGLTACSRPNISEAATVSHAVALERLLEGKQSYPVALVIWRTHGGTANSAVAHLSAEKVLNPSALAAAVCP